MGATQGVAVTVSRDVAAPPAVVWALLTDIANLGRFSPETTRTEWLDGATAASVGARFRGTNKVRFMQWSTTPEVTTVEAERRFAFKVPASYGAEWTYDLEPSATGTLVTESVRQAEPMPLPIRVLLRIAGVTDRQAHLRAGMETTLERLAAAAEQRERLPV